nr:P700 chlorophyll a-apoprotein A2, chloroplastic [Tanacetum cinerariifolium]
MTEFFNLFDLGFVVASQIGPGDFLVHYAIALGLHTTTLILVKGALDARGSKLMPDKNDFGYSFSCDGPGRGAPGCRFVVGLVIEGNWESWGSSGVEWREVVEEVLAGNK